MSGLQGRNTRQQGRHRARFAMAHDTLPPDEPLHDFTSRAEAPERTPEQLEQARREAEHGSPQLRDAGFYVTIARHTEERVPPRNGERYTLLVVEDDPDLGQLAIEIFTLAGFEVRWAANRAEINHEFNHGPDFDLVLLDIMLPDADGLQVLQSLRSHPKHASLPVILMTGKAGADFVQAGLAAGADGYVGKPFRMSALVQAVNLVLGNA